MPIVLDPNQYAFEPYRPCLGKTITYKPCRNRALDGEKYCRLHHPDTPKCKHRGCLRIDLKSDGLCDYHHRRENT